MGVASAGEVVTVVEGVVLFIDESAAGVEEYAGGDPIKFSVLGSFRGTTGLLILGPSNLLGDPCFSECVLTRDLTELELGGCCTTLWLRILHLLSCTRPLPLPDLILWKTQFFGGPNGTV